MVVGGPPWEWPSKTKDARFRMIAVSGRMDDLLRRWNVRLSSNCVHFLQRCFHPNMDQRYRTIEVMLQDPWLSGSRDEEEDDDVCEKEEENGDDGGQMDTD